ncbi:MAG: FHA domain-containing protein, partial [Acidobacteriota bacterium]
MAEGWSHSLLHQDSVFELTGNESVLGRSRHCQITVADPSVSRKHVLLKPGPGHVVVRDLGSSNGTFVNDRKVVSEDVVEHGDTLRVGDAELKVRITGPPSIEQPAPASTMPLDAMPA